MRISTRGRYAVRAMVDLARAAQGRPVPLPTIALRQRISRHYLEQLFGKLRRAGLVTSTRGPGGGYSLARSPKAIAMGDILRAAGEDLRLSACVEMGDQRSSFRCDRLDSCITRLLWQRLAQKVSDVLDSVTLDDLLQEHTAHAGARPSHPYAFDI